MHEFNQGLTFKDFDLLNLHVIICIVTTNLKLMVHDYSYKFSRADLTNENPVPVKVLVNNVVYSGGQACW